jgi:rubredoxin
MADDSHLIQENAFPYQTDHETVEEKLQKEEYRLRLAHNLKDPEFRKIEGFPLGTDEAILALSDPPYYTACPNPFLPEILEQWQKERRQTRKELALPDDENLPEGIRGYHREPFAADVSEGKNDPIYNAHSYHTKVPHKAIMRYILHYTDPGDIVFDGFCGTGMTGVAAQLCGDKQVVESLGYRVDKKGIIYEDDKVISRLGARKAVLNDLSPAATFIAYNYNTPVDARAFEKEVRRILAVVEQECGWMYETTHSDGSKGFINYTVWSDVFRCPHCGTEMAFWNVAVDEKEGNVKDSWKCPDCGSLLAKSPQKESGALKVERVIDTLYDQALDQTIKQARQIPVMINYSIHKKRFEKKPDNNDLALIKQIDESKIPYPFPVDKIPKGDKTSDTFNIGVTHTHHFYTKRNLWVLSSILSKINNNWRNYFLFLITSFIVKTGSKLHNIGLKNGNINLAGAIPNALYIPSFLLKETFSNY